MTMSWFLNNLKPPTFIFQSECMWLSVITHHLYAVCYTHVFSHVYQVVNLKNELGSNATPLFHTFDTFLAF